MAKELPKEIKVGDIVRRRFIHKDDDRYSENGTVVALGKKYKGHVAQPAAKVQFKSTTRVLWYFLDKLQLAPDS